jgi:proteic killer suppression protein
VIKSFRHKGLERFFTTGSKAGIRPEHADKLKKQLAVLENARSLGDIPAAWRPHPLLGRPLRDLGLWQLATDLRV